ncbi:MAG: hypothetical protein AB1671_26320 [Thermodesulfobacteriota bacterium]|jgi:hypothetical protein
MALSAKQRRTLVEKGLMIDLSPHEPKYTKPDPTAALRLFRRHEPEGEGTPPASRLTDGPPEGQPADRTPTGLIPARELTLTVEAPTPAILPADRKTEGQRPQDPVILLAPVQWAVLLSLREAEARGEIVCYRKLAQSANASIRGVRDALAVIEKEGGIRTKVTIRTADEQGLKVTLNPTTRFQPASLREAKGIRKRGIIYRQTVRRKK